MGEKVVEVFKLPENQKVTIKFIKRSTGMAANVADNHIISGGMLEGAVKRFPAPMLRNGSLKNILTKEEKLYFEQEVYSGQNMSMYGKFWEDFYVNLEKLDTTLDLSIPDDYLKYKVLLGWDKVIAPSLKEYKRAPTAAYQFYLERAGEHDQLESKKLTATKAAWKNFAKIESNREVLSAVLFLMNGKTASGSSKMEYLNSQVETLVDKRAVAFNKLMADAQFETKVLIANAERAGVIKKVKGAYETEDGLPITEIGQPATVQNVVAFINNPLNNEVKELILSRLDNLKE